MGKKYNMNKCNSQVLMRMTRKLDTLVKDVQIKINTGELKFSFEYNGNTINVEEELAVLIALIPYEDTISLVNELLHNMSDEDILKLSDSKYLRGNKCRIINSISSAESMQYRYLIYNMIKERHKATASIIMNLLMRIERFLKSNQPELTYGVEKSIVVTVLYWSKINGIQDKIVSITGTKKDIIEKAVDYRETLKEYNPKFADIYFRYKAGEINGREFSKGLVSDGGNLPVPKCFEYYTSPEYSWRVVDEIVGNTSLKDMEYDDNTKEAISAIFQCFYNSMLYTTAEYYRSSLKGLFAERDIQNNKKLSKQVENLMADVKNAESKTKIAKSTIKELRAEIKERKSNEYKLTLQVQRLKDELSALRATGVTSIEPYETEIDNLKCTIEDLNSQLEILKRNHIKKETTISKLTDVNNSLRGSIESQDKIIYDLRNKLAESMNSEGDIPISSLINYINKHRIVIQGGDVLHNQLKELGLKPSKILRANEPLTDPSTIKNCDLLVVITKQQSHCMLESTQVIAERNNIDTLYFNNKNCNKLCKDIFIMLSNKK